MFIGFNYVERNPLLIEEGDFTFGSFGVVGGWFCSVAEMKDSTMKNLAITEKKVQQHKPGDYVGIFFQLIDWKRKLSKKKLFSKKLLPPG